MPDRKKEAGYFASLLWHSHTQAACPRVWFSGCRPCYIRGTAASIRSQLPLLPPSHSPPSPPPPPLPLRGKSALDLKTFDTDIGNDQHIHTVEGGRGKSEVCFRGWWWISCYRVVIYVAKWEGQRGRLSHALGRVRSSGEPLFWAHVVRVRC